VVFKLLVWCGAEGYVSGFQDAAASVRYDGLGRYTHTAGSKLRCQTPTKHTTNISQPLRISVTYSSILPDDGSHTIRNMLE